MFTGIVQTRVRVFGVNRRDGRLTLTLPLSGVKRGASVAVAGVCLTVAGGSRGRARFDVMDETFKKTTLGSLRRGDFVNVERSARIGDELGGHLVSGHVIGRARMISVTKNGTDVVVRLEPEDLGFQKYIFPKGFIALDGASLTVVRVDKNFFTVHLIPETLRRTTFGLRRSGEDVNLEIDPMTRAIVDTLYAALPAVRHAKRS